MSRLFLGKISKNYPIQFEENFYAAGKSDSKWYGGIKPGDYVFPIYNARVQKLWKVREYTDAPNIINKEGSVRFDVVKEFDAIPVAINFLRQKYYQLDLNVVNKSVKSAEAGFFEIILTDGAPDPDKIDFKDIRNIYIVMNDAVSTPQYKDYDIRVVIDNSSEYRIDSIEICQKGKFSEYTPLTQLYKERNPEGERYSLNELLAYAEEDNASKKLKYIQSVIEDLKNNGYFFVQSPVALYDNILVGRKRSAIKKAKDKEIDEELVDDESIQEELSEDYNVYKDLLDDNPNLILYGPPGTGKTYNVMRMIEYIEKKRSGQFVKFEKLIEENRIEFVTFHQSYSYEEFVEGIRPVFANDNSEQINGDQVKYKVEDGIIKKLSDTAALKHLTEDISSKEISLIGKDSIIYKVSLGNRYSDDDIYKDCIENNIISIGWSDAEDLTGMDYDAIYSKLTKGRGADDPKPINDASSIDSFVNLMNNGDIVFIYEGPYTIRDIGVITGDYKYDKTRKDKYPHCRSVKWLKHFDEPYDISKMNSGVRLTMKTVYPLNRIKFSDIKDILKNDKTSIMDSSKRKSSPCYLIIDEINRGNISKIFGELITLIEKDKRDVLKITLPYSRKPFYLPSNIYIIGTMNTADRSIAVLDTALRRRFTFYEVEPDVEVLENHEHRMIEDQIDLARLLETLNTKILNKYDRDHRIGHSYFMNLFNYQAFFLTWYYKIIPLLMEYFYNDSKNVSEIVTDKFIDKETSKIKKLNKKEFIAAIKKIYEN